MLDGAMSLTGFGFPEPVVGDVAFEMDAKGRRGRETGNDCLRWGCGRTGIERNAPTPCVGDDGTIDEPEDDEDTLERGDVGLASGDEMRGRGTVLSGVMMAASEHFGVSTCTGILGFVGLH